MPFVAHGSRLLILIWKHFADLELSGQLYVLDDALGPPELFPKTGPGRAGRIDFGLAVQGMAEPDLERNFSPLPSEPPMDCHSKHHEYVRCCRNECQQADKPYTSPEHWKQAVRSLNGTKYLLRNRHNITK